MKTKTVAAMAFFHEDGLPAAWKQAMNFAGKGGRLATMPDIVAARINSRPGERPWETWYTTTTAEYFGVGKDGKRIIIVAHGIGPMSTLEGIMKAYSWEYKDKSRRNDGGRITQEEFLKLEAGEYGKVEIIDFDEYCKRYQYPFIETLRTSAALTDPILKARLGPRAEQYILAHTAGAKKWHLEQAGVEPENKFNATAESHEKYTNHRENQHIKDGCPDGDPYIIQVGDASNCGYKYIPLEEGCAMAHLIATGRLCHAHHEGNESLTLEIDCHEWRNGVRFVGLRPGSQSGDYIYEGPDAHKLLRQYWKKLMMPVAEKPQLGLRGLVNIGSQWFTQYPKTGNSLDSGEPEYAVLKMQKIGEPTVFSPEISGYYGFFKFDIKDLSAIAPPEANGYYFVSEVKVVGDDHHWVRVQFYKIETDTTKRLIRAGNLARDYDTMMSLMKNK